MDFYRIDDLSSHYADDLDIQVAALEIRARRRFQQERNLYRHSVGIATTKLQQHCLGLIISHRGPNGAIQTLVEEAAMSSGLPVDLWAMHEVKRVWDEIVQLQRVCTHAGAPDEHHQYHDAPSAPVHFGAGHPKPNAGSAPHKHGGEGATRKRAVPRPQGAYGDDLTKRSSPLAMKNLWGDMPIVGSKTGYNIDSTMAQAGENLADLPLPLPPKKEKIKYLSPEDQAAVDKEKDARLEVEAEKQRKEDADTAERERAAARAKDDNDTAKGVLNPVQQMELDEARNMFRGELSEHDQKILAEAKKEFGEDFMEWGFAQTKKVFTRIITGV